MTTSSPAAYTREIYTGENEWYTPADYIALARAVLGDIDLDPASHEIAQETVGAARFFTAADDGLTREWRGRIWLNPPYSRTTMEPFIDKLFSELTAHRVEQAILLTHNYTDTGWFHAAARAARSFCLLCGRIAFLVPTGETATSPVHWQVFFYFGADDGLFRRVFSDVGLIVRTIVND